MIEGVRFQVKRYLYSLKFYVFAGILAVSLTVTSLAFFQEFPSLYEFFIYALLMGFSSTIIHSYIYTKEMHLGGFSLKADQHPALRLFVVVGAVVFWLIAVSSIFGVE